MKLIHKLPFLKGIRLPKVKYNASRAYQTICINQFSNAQSQNAVPPCGSGRVISLSSSRVLYKSNSQYKMKDGLPTAHRSYTTDGNVSLYKEKGNIILMGSPGSGKTTVGQMLSERLNKPVIDVDNDFLESHWGMSVADKLGQLGSEGFLEAEGLALMQLDVSNSIVSLTGSNPMHKEAMDLFKRSGLVVYLDALNKDILARLKMMKVTRIVGQEAGVPMEDILPYRRQFYEAHYDVRIICEPFETAYEIATKIEHTLRELEKKAGYVSTRHDPNQKVSKTFNEVVLEGLAGDGGLYVPEGEFPYLTPRQWSRLVPMSYRERALCILEKWIHPNHLHPSVLRTMVNDAYTSEGFGVDSIVPVEKLSQEKTHLGDQYILELFRGPTASFKDAALQLTPKFFQNALEKRSEESNERYMIVVATSGDTGGAVLDGFSKLQDDNRILVLVLYPEDGISQIQKAQMTNSTGNNIRVVGVESDFDFCQTAIKQIFNDQHINDKLQQDYNCKLSAANSINWGRLLPQVVYHASAYLDLVQRGRILVGQPIDLCVPTGNFGNLLSAYYAQAMGIPFRRMICASNSNNILSEFFNTGRYNLIGRSLHLTASPAIDILKSSNLERLLYHITYDNSEKIRGFYDQLDKEMFFTVEKGDLRKLKELVRADWCVESSCLSCIGETYKNTGYLLDPHTAVAKVVADKFRDDTVPMLIASTAHPAKFAEEVLKSLGHSVDGSTPPSELFQALSELDARPNFHENLAEGVLRDRQHHCVIDANVNDVVQQILNFAAV